MIPTEKDFNKNSTEKDFDQNSTEKVFDQNSTEKDFDQKSSLQAARDIIRRSRVLWGMYTPPLFMFLTGKKHFGRRRFPY